MSFARYDIDRRSTKSSVFYNQINLIVDWRKIEIVINRYYTKADNLSGRPAYSGLVLFKMLLIGIWNNLSDERTELMVNDSLSAMRFCGLELEDAVPDHSTLSRFRTELTDKQAMDKLLQAINKQLEAHKVIVRGGVKVDASIIESPRRPKGKQTYQIAEDRKEDQVPTEEKDKQSRSLKRLVGTGVDIEGRWLKKGGRSIFGFKQQTAVDQNGLVVGIHTIVANEHDSKGLKKLISKLPRKYTSNGIFADKGYKTKKNDDLLKKNKIKNRIMHKAYRNTPLTPWQDTFNRIISKTRWVVERTFGSIKKWFGGRTTRYMGLAKTHTQHVLQAICYNLKRSPGIIMSNCIR